MASPAAFAVALTELLYNCCMKRTRWSFVYLSEEHWAWLLFKAASRICHCMLMRAEVCASSVKLVLSECDC